MSWLKSRVYGAARFTAGWAVALAVGSVAFYVTDYIVSNDPGVTDLREARENAEMVAVARRIYAANGWTGLECNPGPTDAIEVNECGAAGAAEDLDQNDCVAGFCADPSGAD